MNIYALVFTAATAMAPAAQDAAPAVIEIQPVDLLGEATNTFEGCLEHLSKRLDLHEKYGGDPAAKELSRKAANQFLHGIPGSVWDVKGRESSYVVALTDDNACFVYAKTANPNKTRSDFDYEMQRLFKSRNLTPVGQELSDTDRGVIHSRGYALPSPRGRGALFMLLATKNDNKNLGDFDAMFVLQPMKDVIVPVGGG